MSTTVRANRDRILAAIELGLGNSKLEGLNSKIRLISHRGYGRYTAAALINTFYLCCEGLTFNYPRRSSPVGWCTNLGFVTLGGCDARR